MMKNIILFVFFIVSIITSFSAISDSEDDRYLSVTDSIKAELLISFTRSNTDGLHERRKRLRHLFSSIPAKHALHFNQYLEGKKEELSKLFHHKLATATRNELQNILITLDKSDVAEAVMDDSRETGNKANDLMLEDYCLDWDCRTGGTMVSCGDDPELVNLINNNEDLLVKGGQGKGNHRSLHQFIKEFEVTLPLHPVDRSPQENRLLGFYRTAFFGEWYLYGHCGVTRRYPIQQVVSHVLRFLTKKGRDTHGKDSTSFDPTVKPASNNERYKSK